MARGVHGRVRGVQSESVGHLDAARCGRRLPPNRQRRMPVVRAALGAGCRAERRDRQSQGGRDARAAGPVRSGHQLLAARGAGQAGRRRGAKAISQAERREDDSKRRLQPGIAARHGDGFEGAGGSGPRSSRARPGGCGKAAAAERAGQQSRAARKKSCWRPIESQPAVVANYLELADVFTAQNRLREASEFWRARWPPRAAATCTFANDWKMRTCGVRSIKSAVAQRRAEQDKTEEANDLRERMAAQANQAELEVYAARAGRNPGNSLLQYELGLRCKKAGKFKEAIQAFQAARDETRHKALVQLHLGESFQHIRQFKLALSSYEAAVAGRRRLPAGHEKTGPLPGRRAGRRAERPRTGRKIPDPAGRRSILATATWRNGWTNWPRYAIVCDSH